MNKAKQQRKLTKQLMKAQLCETREEAQKIIAKATKASLKLNSIE